MSKETNPLMEEINFKALRLKARVTLRDVERETGISNAYLSQLENGHIKGPSYKTVTTLLEYYRQFDLQSQSLPAVEQPEKSQRFQRLGHFVYDFRNSTEEWVPDNEQPSQPGKTLEDEIKDKAETYAGMMLWLNQHGKDPNEFHEYISEKSYIAGAMEYANQPRKEWISVKSDPPKEAGRYLCVVEEQGDLGLSRFVWNCSYSERHGFMDNFQQMNATYWMPLPDLPTPPQK